mgnify:CR=1 FL=1
MKKHKLDLAILAILPFIIGNTLLAQSAPSLQEILDSAVVHDYEYENKQLALKQIELDQEKIKDTYMPRLELNAKEGYAYGALNLTTPAFAIPQLQLGLPEHANRYMLDNFITQAELKASFVVFAGGKVGNLKKANEARLEAEMIMTTVDRNRIIENVTAIYDQLSMLKSVKLMLDESQKRLNENKKIAEKALSLGLITQYEYNKIDLAITQLDAKYNEYAGKRKLVLLTLQAATKIDLARLEKIDGDINILPVTYVDEPVDRPELIALEAAVRANEYKLKAAKTWWVPKIGASASLSYLGLNNANLRTKDPFILTQQPLDYKFQNLNVAPLFMAGVGLKWDLFDGREGINDVKRSKLDLQIAMNKQADAEDKVTLQLEKNKVELEIASSQIEIKNVALRLAQNAMDQATKEYELGLIKSMELIDAENELQLAQLAYTQAIFQQRRAAISYLEAAGTLETIKLK